MPWYSDNSLACIRRVTDYNWATTLRRDGSILPRFTLDFRQDRATPECHDAVGILAIDSKYNIVSADIDIKGGMGNRFQRGIYPDQGYGRAWPCKADGQTFRQLHRAFSTWAIRSLS